MLRYSIAAALLVALLGACGPTDSDTLGTAGDATATGDGDGNGSGSTTGGDGTGAPPDGPDGPPPPPDTPESDTCDRMDILFVIDDSISMAQEQRNLVDNFPGFIDVLDAYRTGDGAPLDYRVGVTTTGRTFNKFLRTASGDFPNGSFTGADGALQSDCGMTRPWIEGADADPATTFSCIAEVGIGGPTDEMPLAATQLALGARIADGTNAGFVRDDALLALVILTDEDDCSTTGDTFTVDGRVQSDRNGACTPGRPVELQDLEQTMGFLDDLKVEPGRWALAVIAGPGPDVCQSTFGDAIPAHRLLELVDMKSPRASFSSLCEGDLTGALADALETFDAACRSFPPVE